MGAEASTFLAIPPLPPHTHAAQTARQHLLDFR